MPNFGMDQDIMDSQRHEASAIKSIKGLRTAKKAEAEEPAQETPAAEEKKADSGPAEL